MFYFTYILQSLKDKKFYTGYSKDLKRRFELHKKGLVESTKNRLPLRLVYFEGCLNQKDATHREKYLKTYFGKMFLKNRLKSYLTGLISLFFYLFISSFTIPVEAVSCTELNCNGVVCSTYKDCVGVSPYCSCESCGMLWSECCTDNACQSGTCVYRNIDGGIWQCEPAATNTPIPPTKTPTPTSTPVPCIANGFTCIPDEGADTCWLYDKCEKPYNCRIGVAQVCCGPCVGTTNTPTPTKTPTLTPTPTGACHCDKTDGQCIGSTYSSSTGSGCKFGNTLKAGSCFTLACTLPDNVYMADICTLSGIDYKCDEQALPGYVGYYCGYSNTCLIPTAIPGGVNCNTSDPHCVTEDLASFFCNDGSCSSCYVRTARIYCETLGSPNPCTALDIALGGVGYCTHCGDVCAPEDMFIGAIGCEACSGPTNTPPIGSTNTPVPPTNTPTPTRTPTPTPSALTWIKLKNTSFMSSNALNMPIPAVPVAYDADDDGSANFISGVGGLVAASSVSLTSIYPNAKPSTNNWSVAYSMSTNIQTPTDFLAYIKARKSYATISALTEIDSDGVYYYEGASLDINSVPAVFNQYDIVLIIAGTVNISVANFDYSNSVAILATTINFGTSVTYAKGIFIGTTITTGTTVNQGLKIEGNLIAQSTLTNGRQWSDPHQPSLFIINDYLQYLDLLPFLSTASYDWRQTQ